MSEPRPLPSLDQLADQPEAFDSLPPLAQAALLERAEVLAARLRAKLLAARTACSMSVRVPFSDLLAALEAVTP